MKLSNKILIGFFGLVVVYMIAAFTEIGLRGDLNRFDRSTSEVENIDLSKIGHLILPDLNVEIKVSTSNQPKIELLSKRGNLLNTLKYEVKGDTLKLLSFDLLDDEYVDLHISVKKNDLRQIDILDASVRVTDFHQKELSILQKDGDLRIRDNNQIKKLNIIAFDKASINASNIDLDLLNLKANDSDIRIYSEIQRLEGTLTNDSYLVVSNVNEIQFKKDKTSVWRINN